LKLENGNYNIDDLLTYLNARIPEFHFSYDTKTLKVIIVNSTRPFRICDGGNNINTILGFDESISTENLYSNITSPHVFNLSTNVALNILIDSNLNLKTNNVKNSNTFNNILQTVPITGTFGETQAYVSTSNFKFVTYADYINIININILNQDSKPVDFNGSFWYIGITIDFIYKKEARPVNYLLDKNNELTLIEPTIEYEKNRILKK
jgi:hypothetical protein